MAYRKPTKRLHPPKPKGPKDPRKVASMEANRLVTVHLKMRHIVNGVVYGPGEVKLPHNLATGLLHTEGHAIDVEEQFNGTKAVIIGARTPRGVSTRQVPTETFDTEWTNPAANPADIIKGSQYGSDQGKGKPF